MVYKFFLGKKSSSKLYFPIFKLQLQTAWAASPNVWPFSSSTLHIPLSFLCMLVIGWVTARPFRAAPLSPFILSFSFICPSCDPASFSPTSTKQSIFLHAVVVWPISRTHLQSIDKHHSLGLCYKTKQQILPIEMTIPQGNGQEHLLIWKESWLSLARESSKSEVKRL